MIEQHAIEARGRALGLTPRSSGVEVRAARREWKWVRFRDLTAGDTWVDHGIVQIVEIRDDRVFIEAGVPPQPYVKSPTDLCHAFVAV
jgi:hypothetical protein